MPDITDKTEIIDGLFQLVGDEDCGVGINCRNCDRGGMPVAHYESWPKTTNPYPGTDVVFTHSITELIQAARVHARRVHGFPDA